MSLLGVRWQSARVVVPVLGIERSLGGLRCRRAAGVRSDHVVSPVILPLSFSSKVVGEG